MTQNPHLQTSTERRGPTPEHASVVVVAVHGRGQSPQYMIEHLVQRLDDPTICWVLPAADGHSWYPAGFMAPTADNQPWLDQALEAMDAIAASLEHVPAERVVWAGFSQGACLVSEWVARHPRRWGALLAFTGGRIGPEGTDLSIAQVRTSNSTGAPNSTAVSTPVATSTGAPVAAAHDDDFDGMPAYFGAGARDAWVPMPRVEQTADAFRAAGATVTLDAFDDERHEIRSTEIDRARAVLGSIPRR